MKILIEPLREDVSPKFCGEYVLLGTVGGWHGSDPAILIAAATADSDTGRHEVNVCSLENHHISVEARHVTPMLGSMPVGMRLKEYVREHELAFIETTLEAHDGNREAAASTLGISVASLYRKLKEGAFDVTPA